MGSGHFINTRPPHNAAMEPASNPSPLDQEFGGLVGELVKLGQQQDKIIDKIHEAVDQGDKDAVFELAKTLVGYRQKESELPKKQRQRSKKTDKAPGSSTSPPSPSM